MGVFITLADATKPMQTEAVKEGFHETPYGKFQRLQIITIEELLKGKQPHMPWLDPSDVQESREGDYDDARYAIWLNMESQDQDPETHRKLRLYVELLRIALTRSQEWD